MLVVDIKLIKVKVVKLVAVFFRVVGLARDGLRLVEASLLLDLHEALLVVEAVDYFLLGHILLVFLNAAQPRLLDHELEVLY